MEWPASRPDPIEHLRDQLRHAVHARVTTTPTLADLRQMLEYHPTAECDQAGDQHEVKVPDCCGSVWFFRYLLRLLFVKLLNC